MTPDPTTRLREIVEAAKRPTSSMKTDAETQCGRRLARAVADPAFVEKVARWIAVQRGFDPDELRDHRGLPSGSPKEDPEVYPTWRAFVSEAEGFVSLLAAHALGEGDG